MDFLIFTLIAILVAINIKVILDVIKGQDSVFTPNIIFALTVTTQMFPQLVVILTNDFYDKEIIPRLLFVMITSQIAFMYGQKIGHRQQIPKQIIDFTPSKLIYLIVTFALVGLIPMLFYRGLDTVYGGINVILGHFRVIGMISFILTLVYITNFRVKAKKLLYLLVLINAFPLFYFGYFVKGSREILYAFGLISLFFLSKAKPQLTKSISISFIVIFLVGSFFASSMTDIRRTNNYEEEGANTLGEINYWGNFMNSMIQRDITNGMDLGNGAILMQQVANSGSYNFGTGLWNDFVYNFVPGRYISQTTKKKIYIEIFEDPRVENLERSLTNGISTRTGYYIAFKSFSYLGALLFFAFGFLIGKFRKYAVISNFHQFLYIYCLCILPNTITHTTQYMLARLELVFIFLMPILIFFLAKNMITMNFPKLEIARR